MLTHFNITQQGERHIEKRIPCQDYSYSCRFYSEQLNCNVIFAAVSDGVGSCEFSQDGAKIAVNGLIDFLRRNFNSILILTDEKIKKLFESAFYYALEQVEIFADSINIPFLEFDSTLTGAIYDGRNLWFGHIGDDGLVALYTDGTYEMVSKRHKGEEAHSVFPLRMVELWQFEKAPKDVASFALMTDGILDYCVDSEVMNNRVYFPFLEPALTIIMDSDEKADSQKKEWEEYLKGASYYTENFRSKVKDDITLVAVQNSNAVMRLPEIEFDFEQWEEQTKKRRKKLDDVLFADYRAYKASVSNVSASKKAAEKEAEKNESETKYEKESQVSKTELGSKSKKEIDNLGHEVTELICDIANTGFGLGQRIKETFCSLSNKRNFEKEEMESNVKKIEPYTLSEFQNLSQKDRPKQK